MLTCVGSQVSPSVIEALRNHPCHRIRVVGVDGRKRELAVGAQFVDKYFQVPMGHEPGYADAIEEIVRHEKVKVILPGSDEEALSLSKERDRLSAEGCVVACSDYDVTRLAVDKYELMSTLRTSGVMTTDFFAFGSLEELRENAERLGFPARPFVIKPRRSRGGRGFRVVHESFDPYESFLSGDNTVIDFESLLRIFEKAKDKLKDFFVMDYLPGRKYSADCLVRDGTIKAVVMRNKIFPVGSPTQIADIVFDEDLVAYAVSIAKVLKFNYFVQFEIGRDGGGQPKLIEVNPRLDATLPICLGIGINFYHEIVRHALGEGYSHEVRIVDEARGPKRFMRYWQHTFTA